MAAQRTHTSLTHVPSGLGLCHGMPQLRNLNPDADPAEADNPWADGRLRHPLPFAVGNDDTVHTHLGPC